MFLSSPTLFAWLVCTCACVCACVHACTHVSVYLGFLWVYCYTKKFLHNMYMCMSSMCLRVCLVTLLATNSCVSNTLWFACEPQFLISTVTRSCNARRYEIGVGQILYPSYFRSIWFGEVAIFWFPRTLSHHFQWCMQRLGWFSMLLSFW